jgi:hypothetical protein
MNENCFKTKLFRVHRFYRQGCQILLGTIYQNGKKLPNDHKIYQVAICKTYEMVVKYSKWPQILPTFNYPRPSKIYTDISFCF